MPRTGQIELKKQIALHANDIITVRFKRNTTMFGKLRDTPILIGLNGQPRTALITAALAAGQHIVHLPSCLQASLPTDGGMNPADIIPTDLPASISALTIERTTFRCTN